MKFEEVIDKALGDGLFRSPAGLTVVHNLHGARMRRNVASHFSPYDQHGPNEQRATELIALLVCFTDWLALGDDRTHQPVQGKLDDPAAARHLLAKMHQGLPMPADLTWTQLYLDALLDASPRSATKLCGQAVASKHAPKSELCHAIHERLPLLIRRAGPSHINDVLEFIGRLRALRMERHAAIFAALLPIDDITINALAGPGRTLQTAVRVLLYSSRVDPVLYRRQLSNEETIAALAGALLERIRRGAFNTRDLATVLNLLPPRARVSVWHAGMDHALVTALTSKRPDTYLHLLACLPWWLIRQDARLRAAHRRLSVALVARCAIDPIYNLRPLLWQTATVTSVGSPLCDAIAEALIHRMLEDESHERPTEEARPALHADIWADLMWEIANYAPRRTAQAAAQCAVLIAKNADNPRAQVMAWTTAAVLDHSELLQWSSAHTEAVRAVVGDAGSPIWARLRMGYAGHRHDVLETNDLEMLLSVIDAIDPTNPELTPSVRLVDELRVATSGLRH